MKKTCMSVIIIGLFIMVMSGTCRAANASVSIMVNGAGIVFPDALPYVNNDGWTMVPVRFISEQLGATVNWEEKQQAVIIEYAGKRIILPINTKIAYVDNRQVELNTAAIVLEDHTMVPLRFVSEVMGARVLWNSQTSTVRISTADSDLSAAAARNNKYKSPPPMTLDSAKQYYAAIQTNRGDFKIKLLNQDAPATVNNFVFLAKDGFFNSVIFHRLINGFMIQTGDPMGNGTGGPGYKFADELPNKLSYSPGIVAMANSGPNTNGSQFFICNGDQSSLLDKAPNYTIFGQVIAGMDVVQKISGTPVEDNGRGEFSKPMEDIYIKQVLIEEE